MNEGDEKESLSGHNLAGLQNPGAMTGFLEIAFEAVVGFDARERITCWNPAAGQMYGWAAQEALGKTPAKLFWPLTTPQDKKDRRQRQARLKRGETLRGEQMLCRKDSSSLRVQYATRAVFDTEGKLTGYLAVYREVSAPALEDLRARTEEIETLLEVSPVAVFVAHDPECVRITGNPAAYRLVGMSENSQANISKSAPAQERPSYRVFRNGLEVPAEDLPMQKAARLGMEINEEELELCFEDGSQKFIYAFAKPLFDSQGKSRGAIASMLDISERKRVEEQLERGSQKLREILASIQEDFYVLDHDWIFVYANRQFTSRIGKEPEDFVGNNIWKMFPKYMGTIFEENLRAAMEKREIRRFEIPGQYTNAWYSINAVPSPEGITVLGTDITERKRLEAETGSMAKFPLENPNPVLRVSQAGVVLFGNRASQILLDDWNCSIGAPLPQAWRAEVTERFRLGVPGEAILECNGRILSLHLVPVVESHYLNIYGRDITERRQAEEALRQSEERYRHLVQHAPAGIYELDIKTMRFIEVNDVMCQILGYTREELLSRIPEELLDEEGRKHFRERMYRTLSGETVPEEIEYRIRARDGREIWAALNVTINHKDRQPRSVSVIAHDVTQRKQTEETLARQSELLQRVFENIPVLLVMWDPHLQKFTLNRHAETVLGWTTADANSGDFMSMVYPDPAYRAEVSAYMQSLAGGFRELLNVARSGERIPIEWANIRLADDTMIGIGVDLREHKRAEDELRENQKQLQLLNESLEQNVQEKTAEVRHLASELVKAVQRERHRLSHILHDDLQQRVYAIRMQLTFLRDHVPGENETAQSDVADIETQLDEILMVTRSLSVDLSPPILRDEGLAHAISWLAARMRQRYGLPIELQANGPFAIANEELHVLLFNCVRELLFNVVKHAEASRAVVALHWTDSGLQIEVRDDGRGFSAGATGLQDDGVMSEEDSSHASSGLPTIRYQLSLFGGHMEIQSEPGAGARITLSIPVPEGG